MNISVKGTLKHNNELLHPFKHYNIYSKFNDIQLHKLESILSNNRAAEFTSSYNSEFFFIYHPCTKQPGKYQLSFFKGLYAQSDIIRNTIKEISEEIYYNYNSYKLKEVISQ